MSRALIQLTPTKTLQLIERELHSDPRLASKKTRAGYYSDLKGFEAWRRGRPLTKRLVEEYAVYLRNDEHKHAPSSINRALSAIRWWARRVIDLAHEESLSAEARAELTEQAARAASVRGVAGKRKKAGRHIEPGELAVLLRACLSDPSPAGSRDAAILALAWCTGLRRSELAGLMMENLSPDGLSVIGKGDKERSVELNPTARDWLDRWLAVRGRDAGRLFCPVTKAGKLTARARGLTGDALARILKRRWLESGLERYVTWHDFRRTFAGNLLDAGVDIATVQALMGHANPATTSAYDRRDRQVRQRAVDKITIALTP